MDKNMLTAPAKITCTIIGRSANPASHQALISIYGE
jgi:hypothetical protein